MVYTYELLPAVAQRMATEGGQGARQFEMEVKLLSSCSHPNLLPLLGFCRDARGSCLVYPLARGGASRLEPLG